jgi:hypothetical protein
MLQEKPDISAAFIVANRASSHSLNDARIGTDSLASFWIPVASVRLLLDVIDRVLMTPMSKERSAITPRLL